MNLEYEEFVSLRKHRPYGGSARAKMSGSDRF
ncbi:hypothetical protein Mgrana_00609 [Meiothermus granaticius NBRC 107808]|uniref:Uncharacterized protein n=1 Tax=Meiothermus granaticius NBRC 107808 TaxID=1227551 RepID=A0A399FCU8_9DEIN|nr:hypothetical protein Mgrana_00609 [Meiothermus granaticius NBRC 107808]